MRASPPLMYIEGAMKTAPFLISVIMPSKTSHDQQEIVPIRCQSMGASTILQWRSMGPSLRQRQSLRNP